MFPVDPDILGELSLLHSHCSLEKATGIVWICSVPEAFSIDSKSLLGIGYLYNYLYKSIGDSALLSGLGNIDVNQRRVISGSYRHVQSDSTHLGSQQSNELPAEAPSTAAATHHRPGTHSAAPEASFFLQGRQYNLLYQLYCIARGNY